MERDRGRESDTLQGEVEEEKRGEEEADEKEDKKNLGLEMLGHSLPLNLNTLQDSHAKDSAAFYNGNMTRTHRQTAPQLLAPSKRVSRDVR